MRRLLGFLLLLAFLWFAGLVRLRLRPARSRPGSRPAYRRHHRGDRGQRAPGRRHPPAEPRAGGQALHLRGQCRHASARHHRHPAAPGGEALGQAAGLLHPRRLCGRQHAGQCGGDRGLDAGGGASFPAAGDRRLPHAAQPAGIPQRHAEDRDHRPSRLSRPGAPRILVALARHGEPPDQRIRQISGGPAAHRDPWPGHPDPARAKS